MDYIFDTDAIVAFYDDSNNEKHISIHSKLFSLSENDNVYISVLTLYEYHYSLSNSNSETKEKIFDTIESIKNDFPTLPISNVGAPIFGEIKERYKREAGIKRENIKKFNIDLIIASTAIVNSCTVISNDKVYKRLSSIYSDLKTESF